VDTVVIYIQVALHSTQGLIDAMTSARLSHDLGVHPLIGSSLGINYRSVFRSVLCSLKPYLFGHGFILAHP
jgi:hypothetical protein